jgi:acyl carrier protein
LLPGADSGSNKSEEIAHAASDGRPIAAEPAIHMISDPDCQPIEARIRDFIARNLLYSDNGFAYPDDTSFLQEGIIDSLGVMELVEFVSKTFNVKVGQSEVTPAHFDSVARLADFVRGIIAATRTS